MGGALAIGAYTDPKGLDSARAQRDLKTAKGKIYTVLSIIRHCLCISLIVPFHLMLPQLLPTLVIKCMRDQRRGYHLNMYNLVVAMISVSQIMPHFIFCAQRWWKHSIISVFSLVIQSTG